jgi:hypothetical protein
MGPLTSLGDKVGIGLNMLRKYSLMSDTHRNRWLHQIWKVGPHVRRDRSRKLACAYIYSALVVGLS